MVVIIFCDFSIFLSNFSFAVREIGVIVGNKNEIFELPQKLPNELRLGILGNQEISRKSQTYVKL